MDKSFLPKLKGMLNSPHVWDAFVEKLEYDIEQQQRKLEQATDLQQMFKAQGAIAALRHLKYLKEEINGLSK
jgi:division protein CdvB (Snf7/Vps24/ESCRT-III family)